MLMLLKTALAPNIHVGTSCVTYSGGCGEGIPPGSYIMKGEDLELHPLTSCALCICVWDIVKIAKDPTETRPLILGEYSHAMGNSTGNIHEYWEAIDSTEGLQGGFIWDWVDQVLLKEGADGTKHRAYGGDFGDIPNDLNFCLNGLTWPDRIPHPALNEVKYVYQPIKFTFVEDKFKIFNSQYFETTDNIEFSWLLVGDGKCLGSGVLCPSTKTLDSHEIELKSSPWYSLWESSPAAHIYLTMTAKLTQPTHWVKRGTCSLLDQLKEHIFLL
ncbi:hypothetical protein AMTRI_Chr13g121650 [Amborella trichopoda]